MTPLFKKMNYKDQKTLFVLNAPGSFADETKAMRDVATLKTSLTGAKSLPFLLAFVTKQAEVDALVKQLAKLITEDEVVWLAYPKGTSKKYTCEFNRDTGWNEFGKHGFEPVRMVAIDEDWSALRFRRAEKIKKMTRSFAMSEVGKKKVASARKK